ncbi:MAG: alpha-ketoacid dehydrogenase subunit beta, partial [Nanoarchaeota archaeon]
HMTAAPRRITSPDIPTPSTPALANYYYPRHADIIKTACEMVGKHDKAHELLEEEKKKEPKYLDVPDPSFTGPF